LLAQYNDANPDSELEIQFQINEKRIEELKNEVKILEEEAKILSLKFNSKKSLKRSGSPIECHEHLLKR